MIGVSERPCSSSAARSAPTRPSIMSLGRDDVGAGARPARRRCGRAARASRRCRRRRPARSTPQWPWLVYSHRQRSVITSRSGCAALIARVASWIDALVVPRAGALLVLGGGQPEQQHGRDAERGGVARPPATAWRIERWSMPGIVGIGVRAVRPVHDEHRVDEVPRGQLGLADEVADAGGRAQAAQAGSGEGHRSRW